MVGVAAMVVVIGAACGRDEPSGPRSGGVSEPAEVSVPATTVAPTVAPTTPAMTEEQAVLAAVDGYWRTIDEANDPPNPSHPGLETYLTGRALETARQEILRKQQANTRAVKPPNSVSGHRFRVLAVDGGLAAVEDCLTDDFVVVHADGTVIDDSVITQLFVMRLVNDGSGWRVSEVERHGRWEGVQGCALE